MELKICDLTKTYGNKMAVDHLNLTLTNGVYGLLGANGAGKTTLMRLLCDIRKSASGTVLLDGKDIRTLGEDYRKYLGYLPQRFCCYPDFTAMEFLLYIAALKGLRSREAKRRARRLLCAVGLEREGSRKLRTFSGGMKERLGIAQAMLNNPRILILDEPTAGLDPKERVRFRNLIGAFSKDRIVLLSTHIVSDVEFAAEKIVMMKRGKILHFGGPQEITAEICGKVWECDVPAECAGNAAARLLVSNLRHMGNGRTALRVISEQMPLEGAVQVPPSLEDLYLYYFNGEDGADA